MIKNSFQAKCAAIAENKIFTNTIIGLIIFNAIIVGFETYPAISNQFPSIIYWLDTLLLAVFTIEIIIRLIGSSSLTAFLRARGMCSISSLYRPVSYSSAQVTSWYYVS